MTRYRMGMTPSAAHASGDGRDAGHDTMQLQVLNWLNHYSANQTFKLSNGREYNIGGTLVEYPLREYHYGRAAGSPLGYADIGQWFYFDPERGGRQLAFRFFELKPKLHSVGGLIRQCRALSCLAERIAVTLGFCAEYEVIPVVPHDDPKFVLLTSLFEGRVIGWDSERGIARRNFGK